VGWGCGVVLSVGWVCSFLGRFGVGVGVGVGVGFEGVFVGLKNASRVRFAIVAWNWEVRVKFGNRDATRSGKEQVMSFCPVASIYTISRFGLVGQL
jgi:hypothetical protein